MGRNYPKLGACVAAATLLVAGVLSRAAGAQTLPLSTFSVGFVSLAASLSGLVGSP